LSIGSLVGRIIPTATAFVASGGNPVAALGAYKAADEQRDFAKKIRLQQEDERAKYMEIFGGGTGSTFRDPYASSLVVNKGTAAPSSGFFGDVRSGLREFGGLVSDVFASGIPQLFGKQRPPGVGQQPAVTTVTNVGAQESQGSGSIQAGVGSLLPQVIGGARSLLKSPLGQLALGTGAGVGVGMLGADGKAMRITRKMKSQARMVLNMTGGNLQAAADILGIDPNMLVMILLKRFRNDGPVVTKAALRKTKQTVRRLKSMCDMYDDLRPRATARRRAPMRRASTTTLIKN
jgi:hypothetical protein